ncbi:MAG: aminotransferase class IV [Alphaproteobacteria bacterium]|nr:aminotransferase class IV [Alphaproteobacteria bacterium]
MIILHNDQFIEDAPVLSIHDSLRLGFGVFRTMLVIDGTIIHAQAHFEKLLSAAELLMGQWDAPPWEKLHENARMLLGKNDFLKGRYAFNAIVTGGPSGNGIRLPAQPTPQLLMRALPFNSPGAPIKAAIALKARRNEGSPLSKIKYTNYGENILALREVETRGANEAVMLSNAGNLSCASVANLVIVQDGKLWTPPLSDGCQDGLTRTLAIQRLGVREKSFSLEDIHKIESLYLINSLRGAVPVVSLNDTVLSPPSIKIEQDFHIP